MKLMHVVMHNALHADSLTKSVSRLSLLINVKTISFINVKARNE